MVKPTVLPTVCVYPMPPTLGKIQARNDALEEAAQEVIKWRGDPIIAFAIRELKTCPE